MISRKLTPCAIVLFVAHFVSEAHGAQKSFASGSGTLEGTGGTGTEIQYVEFDVKAVGDGNLAKGHLRMERGDIDIVAKIDCMWFVDSNTVVLSGPITKSDPETPATVVLFSARDTGDDDEPDQMSEVLQYSGPVSCNSFITPQLEYIVEGEVEIVQYVN